MSSFVIQVDVSALVLNQNYQQSFNSATNIRYKSIPGKPKPQLVIHNHSGNFLQFNLNGSDRNFCIQANGLSDQIDLDDKDIGITYTAYAQAAGYPAAWAPNILMLVLYSAGEKPVIVANGAGFNIPAATIGPGALPEGVTIGADDISVGEALTVAQILLASTLSSADKVIDLQQGYAIFSDNAGSFSGSATRLWFVTSGTLQNTEIHFGPRSGNVINYVRFRTANVIIDGTSATTPGTLQVTGGVKISFDAGTITSDGFGNLTVHTIAAGTITGAQVTGDIAANQVGPGALDTDVTMSANQLTTGVPPSGVTIPGAQITGDLAANQIGPGALDTDVTMNAAQVQAGALPTNVENTIFNGSLSTTVAVQSFVGTTDPSTYATVDAGDSWDAVAL